MRTAFVVVAAFVALIFAVTLDASLSWSAEKCDHPMAEVIKKNEAAGFHFKALNADQAKTLDELVGEATGTDLTGADVTIAQQHDGDTIIVGFSKHGCFIGAIPMDPQDLAAIIGQGV